MIKLKNVHTIIGIDQTGAKKGKNKTKDLPISILRKHNSKWYFDEENIFLEKIDIKNLSKLSISKGSIICIDSVLGLPKEYSQISKDIKFFIKKTKEFKG